MPKTAGGRNYCPKKEIALEPLNPREIQFRVRAGESPEMVAAATGWPVDRVVRYAEPPLGERAYVAEQAQKTFVHASRGGASLADLVLVNSGVDSLIWDSFYAEGQWIVSAQAGERTALWTYEPQGKTVHPVNDLSRIWMGLHADRVPEEEFSESDTVILETAEPVRLVAVPQLDPDTEGDLDDSTDDQKPADMEIEVVELDLDVTPQVPPKKIRRGRAKVPSWDEILFGGPKDQ